jgi:hypothetical protein
MSQFSVPGILRRILGTDQMPPIADEADLAALFAPYTIRDQSPPNRFRPLDDEETGEVSAAPDEPEGIEDTVTTIKRRALR